MNIKQHIEKYTFKRTVMNSNSETVLEPFFLGSQISYQKLGSYIFVNNTDENIAQLRLRGFIPTSDIIDDVLKLGIVFYNKKFNLLFVLIEDANWELFGTCLNVANSVDASLEIKCQYLINSFNTF